MENATWSSLFLVAAVVALPFGSAFSQPGNHIDVPSDPIGRYSEVEGKRITPAVVEILTRREAKPGTSYSVRDIDCVQWTFRYSGEGNTIGEAKARKPPNQMVPLTKGSISTDIADYACGNVK